MVDGRKRKTRCSVVSAVASNARPLKAAAYQDESGELPTKWDSDRRLSSDSPERN